VSPSVSCWNSEKAEPDPKNSELMSILEAHLATVPEPVQEILWIRFAEGGTWSDVAGEMRMTLRAVQRRFQRFGEVLRAEVRTTDGPFPNHRFPP
jgi:DNA-directed RNA polymerase specialized sigma24 family protein